MSVTMNCSEKTVSGKKGYRGRGFEIGVGKVDG